MYIGGPEKNFRAIVMNNKYRAEIDFDTWSAMARRDPETFESMRLAAIEEAIESAPAESRERLRRLQWRIDQERRLAGSPMHACIRLSGMMWRSVTGRGGLQQRLNELQWMIRGARGEAADITGLRPAGEVVTFAAARNRSG